jgi:hypothetical protein
MQLFVGVGDCSLLQFGNGRTRGRVRRYKDDPRGRR